LCVAKPRHPDLGGKLNVQQIVPVRESGVDGRKKAVKSVYVTAKTRLLSWCERCVCHVAAICAPLVEAH